MCGSNEHVLSFAAHIESLRETHQAQMSHLLGLVLIAYAKIAHAFLQSQCQDKGPMGDVDKSPEAASRKFLEGYQMLDFCQIMHASRTHSLNFSKKYFETMIAPAYYDTHLQYPLMAIRSIFESFQPWQGTEHQSTFVHSELFSPSFFRGLIGCFGTNTLEVIVAGAVRGSALFGKFSKMNHSCRKNTVNCDCEAASVRVFASQAIQCGEEITTTYRFDESGCTTEALAYIVRKRALDQYLFRCGVVFTQVILTCIVHSCLSCKCELCAPHICTDSPQGSDDLDDSSDCSDSPVEASEVANAIADAAKCKEQEQQQLPQDDPEAALALLRSQKREAIRKAVEAQRAELSSCPSDPKQ